jgi:hypothetical protein
VARHLSDHSPRVWGVVLDELQRLLATEAHERAAMAERGTGAAGQPGLWSAAHGLWFRDHTFVASEPPVFWARGNAWAAATIIGVLSLDAGALPAWDPLVQDLEETLAAMAAAVAPLQGADGFWRANLLDAGAFPEPETSGTAGLLALLAFGVRTGRLSARAFAPAIAAGWAALSTVALRADGAVGHCQPEAAAPGPSSAANSSDFCTGLWLLAANEVFALVSGPPLPPLADASLSLRSTRTLKLTRTYLPPSMVSRTKRDSGHLYARIISMGR